MNYSDEQVVLEADTYLRSAEPVTLSRGPGLEESHTGVVRRSTPSDSRLADRSLADRQSPAPADAHGRDSVQKESTKTRDQPRSAAS